MHGDPSPERSAMRALAIPVLLVLGCAAQDKPYLGEGIMAPRLNLITTYYVVVTFTKPNPAPADGSILPPFAKDRFLLQMHWKAPSRMDGGTIFAQCDRGGREIECFLQ